MEKSDRLTTSQRRKCPVCHEELPADHTNTDLALYIKQTNNLIMSTEQTCLKCKEEMVKVRNYVEQQALCFGKDSQIFKSMIQPELGQKTFLIPPETSIYQKYVENEIKRNKLYHCGHLPQSIRQLVYYSSFSVHQAERHERIKNSILRIMQMTTIPFNNLQDISILVHYLACFMNQINIVRLFKVLHHNSLAKRNIFTLQKENNEEPYDLLYSKLYKNIEVPSIIIAFWALMKNWDKFPLLLDKIKNDEHLKGMKKLKQIIEEGKQEQTINGVECHNCELNRIKNLEEITKMKNNFTIVWKQVKREEEILLQYINQMQLKFCKEKEEFINKIIKLKDKIDLLERNSVQGRPRSASQSDMHERFFGNIKKLSSSLIKEVSQKSQSTIKTQQKIQQNNKYQESQSPRKYQVKNLHNLLSELPDFDPSLFSEQVSEEVLIETIEKGMKKMKDDLLLLEKKSRTHEHDSKRLLDILTRKQEKFVPLLHEKDDIIERYENAIWKMQNQEEVTDQILAPRIEGIIKAFRQRFGEQIIEYNDMKTQKQEKYEEKKEKSGKKKKKKSSVKKEKKEEQKQCSIY